MPADYLPSRDQDLAAWAANYATLTRANYADYGLTEADALAIAAYSDAYRSALLAATDPATRTRATVNAKDDARANARSVFRRTAALVQAFPGITGATLATLGLTIRSTNRTPTPPPATAPILTLLSQANGTIRLAIADTASPLLRRKPPGVLGAELVYVASATPPVSWANAKCVGLRTRTPFQIAITDVPAGDKVWMSARWINRRGEVGPYAVATPVIIID